MESINIWEYILNTDTSTVLRSRSVMTNKRSCTWSLTAAGGLSINVDSLVEGLIAHLVRPLLRGTLKANAQMEWRSAGRGCTSWTGIGQMCHSYFVPLLSLRDFLLPCPAHPPDVLGRSLLSPSPDCHTHQQTCCHFSQLLWHSPPTFSPASHCIIKPSRLAGPLSLSL